MEPVFLYVWVNFQAEDLPVAKEPLLCHTLRAMVASLVRYIPAAQILVAVLLVTIILFQPSTAGVGGSFGGGDNMQNFHTKRGLEKFLFIMTIVLGILFAALCVLAVVF